MLTFKGKGVFSGVAFGMAHILNSAIGVVHDGHVDDTDGEWSHFVLAKEKVNEQLTALFEKTKREIGEDEAMIIDVQRLMLEDGDYNEMVKDLIYNEKRNAAYATEATGNHFAEFFESLDDPYMKARAIDIADVSKRIVQTLLGVDSNLQLNEPSIVIAEDLTPSETLQMDKSKILAFVIQRGSSNSHTAILARSMGIPCIIQCDIPLDESFTGKEMAIDGERGFCYVEPSEEIRNKLQDKHYRDEQQKNLLNTMKGLPTVTKDGRTVRLYSNIGDVDDIENVLKYDSEGIGLFRTEFQYLGRKDFPSEDELFNVYKNVAERMKGKQVIIRTLDIGADKKVDYFELDEEENPALGLRGIRICIRRPDILWTQLRAIYRASAFGNIAIMFPMIVSLWEVRYCIDYANRVRTELINECVDVGVVELGIMIETPASVLVADELAKEVDFFSVGTNDLTQYIMAIDRQNEKLEKFHDPLHPAILRSLDMVAQAAKNNNIWAGICGELAADTSVTKALINMGYSELSVSPVHTLGLRKVIREIGEDDDIY
jgi:phosphotransferase system enzyme I (PtsI)